MRVKSGADNDLSALVGGGGVLLVVLAGLSVLDWCSVVGVEAFGVSQRLRLLLENISFCGAGRVTFVGVGLEIIDVLDLFARYCSWFDGSWGDSVSNSAMFLRVVCVIEGCILLLRIED